MSIIRGRIKLWKNDRIANFILTALLAVIFFSQFGGTIDESPDA